MSDKTYGYIKKRVLDALDECSDHSSFVSVSDTEKDVIENRLPDSLNASLIRMYKSLSVGQKSASFPLFKPEITAFCKSIDKDAFLFENKTESCVIVFYGAGGGSIEILDKDGELCFEMVCGGGEMVRYANFCNLEKGRYTVKKNGFLTVKDFVVYNKADGVDIDAYAPYGFAAFPLPDEFSEFEGLDFSGEKKDGRCIAVNGGYAYLDRKLCTNDDTVRARFRINPPFITSETQESFEFDLCPLAVEALICLCASELCKEGDTARYSRLVYKYTDLAEGLRDISERGRNSFFRRIGKMRW